jgi:hypothetical protein
MMTGLTIGTMTRVIETTAEVAMVKTMTTPEATMMAGTTAMMTTELPFKASRSSTCWLRN